MRWKLWKRPVRKCPHWTPSMKSSSFLSSHNARSPSKYSGGAGVMPPSPWMPSMRIATVAGDNASRIAAKSLNGTCRNPGTIGSKPFLTFS